MEEKTPEYLVNRGMPHEFDRSKRESETLSHGGGWVRGVLYRGGMLQRGGVLQAVASCVRGVGGAPGCGI